MASSDDTRDERHLVEEITMSAFVVADAHINALVTWAALHRASVWLPSEGRRKDFRGNEQWFASVLYTANVESVNDRYREDEVSTGFRFRTYPKVHTLTPVVILKACSCFDYQACEVDNYEATTASRIIDAIRHAAIRALPGYENAAGWEIRD